MYLNVIGFLIGVVSVQFLPILLPISWLIFLLIAIVLLWYFLPVACRAIYHFLFMLILGCFWVTFFAQSILSWELSKDLEGKTVTITGVVSSLPHTDKRQVRFEFNLESLNGLPQKKTKVLLSWYGYVDRAIGVGEKWQFDVRLKRPHGLANPGGFDYEKWLLQNKIRATGYIVTKGNNQYLGDIFWRYSIDKFRSVLAQKIHTALINEKVTGMVVALVMGLQKGITSSQWDVMRATGTSHLMAISGMHIGFVAGFVYFLVSFIWRRIPKLALTIPCMQAAALAGFIAAVCYAALAGFSLPTQRAVIMLFAFLLGLLFRRTLGVWNAFLLALLMVLLWDPLSTFSLSFWLSFGAVFAIIFGISGRVAAKGLWWKYGRVQWVVTLMLMPLCLLLFQQASLVSFFANIVSVPLVGFLVLPLCLLGALSLLIYAPLGQWLLFLAAKIIDVIWVGLGCLSEWQFSVWQQNIPNTVVLIFLVIGILLLLMPKGMPSRSLGLLCFFPLFFYQPSEPKYSELSLVLLDVGQGLSIFVQTQNHALLFDTGPRFGSDDAGQRVILPFLKTKAVTHMDKLIISHGDSDHSGGANSVLDAVSVGSIFSSVPGKFDHADLCERGEVWHWDGVEFEFLYPPKNRLGRNNDSSCVLKISVGEYSVLLTGDIEKSAERYLLEHSYAALKSNIIIAPHHGSKTSSTPEFIQAVQPEYVLYPAGYRNRFRFPHAHVVERYNMIGAFPYITGKDGAIILKINSKGVEEIVGYRKSQKRFWR
jgi:competence protein ComEC